jgi:transketolase
VAPVIPDLVATPADDARLEALAERAAEARRCVVRSVARARAGHLGGPLSAIDVLTVLYGGILRVRPDEPDWPDRDRFVLSKGHASIGLYAVLALAGFFPVAELETFDEVGSRLQGHPDMTRLPGLDMSTGSLGLGLSTAVGMAYGARRQGRDTRVVCMLGDGECQEGQVWEAAASAVRFGLEGLVAIVDVNGLQQFGWVDPEGERTRPWTTDRLAAIWASFGWRVLRLDGHDLRAIADGLRTAIADAEPGQPTVVLAETTKGRGVSFMEGRYEWHAKVPTADEADAALAELGA